MFIYIYICRREKNKQDVNVQLCTRMCFFDLYIHIYTYACNYTCKYIHIYIHIYIRVYTYVYIIHAPYLNSLDLFCSVGCPAAPVGPRGAC